jgi:hypothetical protein
MATMHSRTWRFAIVALAGALSIGVPTSAQTLMRSPEEISHCLCQNRNVDELKTALDRQFRLYEESRKRYAALEDEVDAVRARMDVRDRDQIESFQRLLDERDAAQRSFQDEATPAYNAVVQRYNGAVDAYNASCANAVFDPIVLAQVQKSLYCPR